MSSSEGIAYLVGAGPGDPGLLTVRAVNLIAQAEVILYDRLIPPGVLSSAAADAELVYVGKQPGNAAMSQEEINQRLVEYVAAGKRTVRLKGGDPFVFGRGGEEAAALKAAGLPFEVVPGVTAGIAASAYAGIPVTHRGLASAVAFVTGHEDPTKPGSDLNWQALADFPGTLVFYMGIKQLPQISAQLIAAGRSPEQPVAVVERGTYTNQRSVSAPLSEIADVVAAAEIKPPALTVIGDVASLTDTLAWRPVKPLAGKRVVVTRARNQAGTFAERLRQLGAEAVETPLIEIKPLPVELPALREFDLLCVTSPNAAYQLFELLAANRLDTRALAGLTVAAIGPGTVTALAAGGVRADIMPRRSVAEGLLEALEGINIKRALILRPKQAREVLPEGLRARGVDVSTLSLYETKPRKLSARELEELTSSEILTFASASAVQAFVAAVDGKLTELAQTKIVSIGPVTSAELQLQGLRVDHQAEQHDLDGLTAAVLDAAS